MLSWIIDNIATIIICLILLAIVLLIIFRLKKDKQEGKSSCGAGCASCPMHGKCHKQ